jgi:Enolase, C-terminal TIM barrel domain
VAGAKDERDDDWTEHRSDPVERFVDGDPMPLSGRGRVRPRGAGGSIGEAVRASPNRGTRGSVCGGRSRGVGAAAQVPRRPGPAGGDDVFAASPALVRRGIEERVANAVVIKPNQVGTLSETLRAIAIAREAGVGSDRLASFWRDRGHHDRGPRGRRAGGADQGWRPVPRRADCQVQPFAADRRGGGG